MRSSDTSTATSTAACSPTPRLRSLAGNGLPINQTIYVVTNDGFRYQTDTRGLDPNGYLFYGSRTGFLDADGDHPARPRRPRNVRWRPDDAPSTVACT